MSYGYVLAAAFVILIGGFFTGRWSAVKYPAELDVGDYVMISNCNMSNVKLILPKDGLKGFTMSNNPHISPLDMYTPVVVYESLPRLELGRSEAACTIGFWSTRGSVIRRSIAI